MNENERDRIADAMHHLRPDWPVKQLRTLLTGQQLTDRPRRDVLVALAWVAAEPGTASPYRVLESGPWWRAAATESAGSRNLNRGPWCGICGQSLDDHRATDHEPERQPDRPEDRKRTPESMAAIVEDMRGRKEPTKPRPEDAEDAHDPRADQARAAIATEETTP